MASQHRYGLVKHACAYSTFLLYHTSYYLAIILLLKIRLPKIGKILTPGSIAQLYKQPKIGKKENKMKRIKAELKNTRNFRNMPDVYVPYPLMFALKHDLTAVQTLLYAIIRQYSKLKYKAYTGSIQTLQVTLNVSRSTTERALNEIVAKGVVKKTLDENGRNVYTCVCEPEKKEIYIPFPLRYAVEYGLTAVQTLLYAIIVRFSKLKNKAYTGSIQTLQNALNCSRITIITSLEELIRRGFVIKYKDESANITFVDGLSHRPGKTDEELEFNALWVKENGLTRCKKGRSQRKKTAGATWFNEAKNTTHFENERKYSESDLEKLFANFDEYKP